jgi:hypothetical protein
MTSSLRSFSQKTGSVFNNGGYAPNIFQVSDIESAFLLGTANPRGSKVGASLYIGTTQESLNAALNTLNTSSPASLSSSNEYIVEDMGKKIYVGIVGQPNLLIFSKIKRSLLEPTAPNATAYIVSENRTTYQNALYPPSWRGGA